MPGSAITRTLFGAAVSLACVSCLSGSALAVQTATGSSAPASVADSAIASLTSALALVHLSRADLALPRDYEDPDEWRLKIVDRAMSDPLSVGEICEDLAGSLTADSAGTSLAAMIAAVAPALEPSADAAAPAAPAATPAASPGGAAALAATGSLRDILLPLVEARDRAVPLVASAFQSLSAAERDTLVREGPKLIEEDVNDPSKSVFQLYDEKNQASALGERVFAIAARVRRADLVRAGLLAAEGLDRAREVAATRAQALGGAAPVGLAELGGAAEGDVLYYQRLPDGARVIVGGPGRTIYREPFDIIVDLGGDDEYLGGAGGTLEGRLPVSLALDLAGDDLYHCVEPGAIAGGCLGVGMVVDVAGNDTWVAGNFALGGAWFGVGALLDLAGDDHYTGDTVVEGAASVGVGLLSDRSGADSYEAALASQGFGFVGGLGALDDRAGNDFYLMRPRYTDLIRYEDHFVSLSQGFGFGHRPEKSGGIGLLVEGGGNDLYFSDIFGQGAAYWYALGCLVDRGGNDSYVSHQYAQGAGIHLASAALVDEAGEDSYFARGVSQGCGHDLGVGMLWDMQGDDTYTAFDLSQGAGSANGVGILVDDAGEDGYWVKRADNTHGYGNPRREYGSTGLLVDLAGRDHYAGRGADTTAWTGPWFGAGMDLPGGGEVAAPAAHDTAVVPPPPPGGAYTPETLFILAAALEPRLAHERAWARAELVKSGAAAVPVLLSHLGTTDAPERQALTDLLKQMGEAAAGPLADSLASRDWRVALLAARTLGEMQAAAGHAALLRASNDSRWVIRESAVTALGKLHDMSSLPRLKTALGEDRSPYVRKSAAFALGELGGEDAVAPLVAALGDERGMVRETARASLAALDSVSTPVLRRVIAAEAAGARSRQPRAVALAIEALRDMGRSIPGASLRALIASPLWADAEVRESVARMLAASREDRDPGDQDADHFAWLELAADTDFRVRGLVNEIRSRGTPGVPVAPAAP